VVACAAHLAEEIVEVLQELLVCPVLATTPFSQATTAATKEELGDVLAIFYCLLIRLQLSVPEIEQIASAKLDRTFAIPKLVADDEKLKKLINKVVDNEFKDDPDAFIASHTPESAEADLHIKASGFDCTVSQAEAAQAELVTQLQPEAKGLEEQQERTKQHYYVVCNARYLGDSDCICFKQQEQRIADLEAKLADAAKQLDEPCDNCPMYESALDELWSVTQCETKWGHDGRAWQLSFVVDKVKELVVKLAAAKQLNGEYVNLLTNIVGPDSVLDMFDIRAKRAFVDRMRAAKQAAEMFRLIESKRMDIGTEVDDTGEHLLWRVHVHGIDLTHRSHTLAKAVADAARSS
jgi:NTP pyrophosphatase (non-canonical NTP hydrolase)